MNAKILSRTGITFLFPMPQSPIVLILLATVLHCSCSVKSSPDAASKTAAVGNERYWFLMYEDVSEQEFKEALPLAKAGDVEAIKKVCHYYDNNDQSDIATIWYQRYEEATKKVGTH